MWIDVNLVTDRLCLTCDKYYKFLHKMFLLYLFQSQRNTSQGTTPTASRISCKTRTIRIVAFLSLAILWVVIFYFCLTEVGNIREDNHGR